MGNHCGAAHSCSSIADLVLKNIQRFKEKLALNRWMFFWSDRQNSSSVFQTRNDDTFRVRFGSSSKFP
jgi:hypothetical protein